MGQVSRVPEDSFESQGIEECYLSSHRDAEGWVPSRWGYHASFWARFDPKSIYYVGGFGGLHYIGNIPLDLYQQSGKPEDSRNTEDGNPAFPQDAAYDQMPMLTPSQGRVAH